MLNLEGESDLLKNKIQVLQVCYVYPPSFSGYGKQLSTVNNYFVDDQDINIDIITAYGGNDCKNVHSIFSIPRPEVSKEKLYYYIFAIFAPFFYMGLVWNANVIHIVKAGPEVIIWIILSKILGKKIVIKVAQEELEVKGKLSLVKRFRYWLLRHVDKLVALSSKIESEAINLGISSEKIIRINNAFFENKAKQSYHLSYFKNSNLAKRKITYVGALCHRKGIPELLEAFYMYNDSEDLHVSLVGPDYKEIDNLEYLINKAMSNPKITIEKTGNRSDAVEIISQSDFLILPSHSEGMPNVVIESLMVGTPVIASNIPVVLDMIDNSNGVVSEIGSSKSICECISIALNREFNRSNIKRNASKKYSLKEVGYLYKKLYVDLGSK